MFIVSTCETKSGSLTFYFYHAYLSSVFAPPPLPVLLSLSLPPLPPCPNNISSSSLLSLLSSSLLSLLSSSLLSSSLLSSLLLSSSLPLLLSSSSHSRLSNSLLSLLGSVSVSHQFAITFIVAIIL